MAETRTTRGSGRAALTGAAREVIAERGYHGASIRDIAARAGLSLTALYHWHAGKQELFVALLRESRQDYLDTCRAAVATAPDEPAERLAALVRATVDYRVRRRVESEISAREWRHVEPRFLGELDEFRVAASTLWSDVVEDGAERGDFGCDHADEARRAIQAACNAIPGWYDPAGAITPDELADRYVAIALRIVGCRSGAGEGRGDG